MSRDPRTTIYGGPCPHCGGRLCYGECRRKIKTWLPSGKPNPRFISMIYNKYIAEIRLIARDRGYAIALHGSLAKDIDLVAIPWTDDAVPPDDLVADILKKFEWFLNPDSNDPELKPHGRKAWSLHSVEFESTWIDFSVLPPIPPQHQ